ncbi:hypothetical protein [Butyrivibrio proteoclasticus]|uniref:hypothetical protein n=1 Tax=Butyrivibrio proteoclasticus TaxID=43305 RepID=UPI00047BCEEF|nr:hypothetical protein [Butyrivibrio proteoclasticus]
MKATEFCRFFDFDIRREEGFSEFGSMYRFVITDTQGTVSAKYIVDIYDVTEAVDICLGAYIDETLLDYGFIPDENCNDGYYEQALKFITEGDGDALIGTNTHKVIECLCDPKKIEDDVTGDNSENVKSFVYDYFAETLIYAPTAIDALCEKENTSLQEIMEAIITAADTDSIGGKESIQELYATLFQQLSTVCLEDFLSGIHELYNEARKYAEVSK